MGFLVATTTTFLLVNLLFAGLALAIGFVAGGWFLGGRNGSTQQVVETDAEKALEERMAIERAMFASARLQDLTSGVASDVGAHSCRVEQISADLEAAKNQSDEQRSAKLTNAFSEILDANSKLQKQLEVAEQQIKSQAEEIRTHESEARTDSLTKIANRRAFDDHLNQRFAEWQRKATPFSLLILDVDHFKKFNDTHGHQAGDEVLRQVAASLTDTAREMDIPCRYGGEEFAIVLPATVARDACGFAERVRKGIESLRIEFEGKTLSVTASVGLAQVGQYDNPANLLKRADAALYASKGAGRNCGHLEAGDEIVPVVGAMANAKPKPDLPTEAEKVATVVLDKLPNRTLFTDELRRRIAACERTLEPLSVLAVEFPGHEAICEEYGEAVATLTLDSVANFLKTALREMDLLGRLDDSRLAAMLPTAAMDDAQRIADRAAAALSSCSVPMGDAQLSLDTRMGVAELRPDDTASSLLSRASEALAAPLAAAASAE